MAALTYGHNPFSKSDFIQMNPKYPSSLSKTIEMFRTNSNVLFKLLQYLRYHFHLL